MNAGANGDIDFMDLTVLVAEDEAFVRGATVKQLQKLGVGTVIEAEDGRKALAALERAELPFDIMLVDIEMPLMDGLTLANKVQGADHLPGHPAMIFLTGRSHEAFKEAAARRGAAAYLEKPASLEVLRDTMVQVLKERAAKSA